MRDHLVLFVNGQRLELGFEDACMTLADFLRRRLGLSGTKIVCNEGDCGACSVLMGRVNPEGERLRYQTIDSCITFLYQLDRSHVVTVEGLGSISQLTPIQNAMVAYHGSQCGYCTPGFVMAMHGMIESDTALTDESLRYGLSGNLCRCTGYQQIFDAGRSVDVESVAAVESRYPSRQFTDAFRSLDDGPVTISGTEFIHLPRTIEQACQWKSSRPEAIVVSGATDIGVLHNHGRLRTSEVLCLSNIDDFDRTSVQNGCVSIGGGTTWSKIEQTVRELFPPYYEIITRFGSPQIRNLGTIGGNLATGSPIADSIPFHLVMDSQIHLASIRGTRTVQLNDFYSGYRENVMANDELIVQVDTPLLKGNEKLALHKVSKRRDMDISTLTLALWIRTDGVSVLQARLAIGGVGPTVARIPAAEALLVNNSFTLDTFQRAGAVAKDQISPWSDVRGSADYRLQLAENLLVKSFHQFTGDESPNLSPAR